MKLNFFADDEFFMPCLPEFPSLSLKQTGNSVCECYMMCGLVLGEMMQQNDNTHRRKDSENR